MKIINNHGKDITKEFEAAWEKIRASLKFYKDCEHYHWDGCHCHGSYVLDDHGEKAEEGMSAIEYLDYDMNDPDIGEKT